MTRRKPGRPARAAQVALLALVGSVALAQVTRAERMVELPLSVEGRIDTVAAADLDGDSRKDLLVVSVSGRSSEAERRLSVFLQTTARRFAQRPEVIWDLDPRISALDPYPSDGSTWLYSLRADGVWRHGLDPERRRIESERVVAVALSHLIAEDESVALLDFASTWAGTREGFLVPDFPHPRLVGASGGGRGVTLPVAPEASYGLRRVGGDRSAGELIAYYRFSLPIAVDQDGDGRREIVFLEHDRVTIFDLAGERDADGGERASDAPSRRVFPVRVLTDAEAALGRYETRSRLVDLDGDGRTDLAGLVYRDTGVLEFEGRILIFRARPDGSFPETADQVIRVDDALYHLTQFLDLDGDGAAEILVPSARLGLWGYIRLLATRKASFHFNTLASREGRYETVNAVRDSMTARLSESYELPVIALADMNGDGVRDLVLGSAEQRVCIYDGMLNRDDRRFSRRPRLCFDTDPYARFLHVDLDGDGAEELVRHALRGNGRNRLWVAFLEK